MDTLLEFVRCAWSPPAPTRALSLQELAAGACISAGYLSRVFRQHHGIGPVAALELLRLARAATLLSRSNLSVAAVADDCGFANPYHVSRRFHRIYGQPPGRYRRATTRPEPGEPLAHAGLLALSDRIWQATENGEVSLLAAAPPQYPAEMRTPDRWVVVGLDNGGTSNNATVLDASGRFLVDRLVETPSLVREGPDVAVAALAGALDNVLDLSGMARASVAAVGLDTPGPASADGVISSKGSTNFSHPGWRGFDVRGALQVHLGLPVVYNNDANAAALYAHHVRFAPHAAEHSSISVIVGTGLGGGVIEAGQVVRGAAGMAGELGHVPIPMEGLLADGQPPPRCNCGFVGDAESVASLTGIEKNLLPYWLTRFAGHQLGRVGSLRTAAKLVRAHGERGDPLALSIFEQQAMALGRLFTIAASYSDPSAYFLGGGVVETTPQFRDWFVGRVREHMVLREEQARVATLALVPDLDMAGARGAAIAALESLRAR